MNFQTSVSPLRFWKMQGCGNHFVVTDLVSELAPRIDAKVAQSICAKHTGIGSDGIFVITAPSVSWAEYDVIMRNPDGSLMGMCGNGIRCVALYVYEHLGDEVIERTFNVEGKAIRTKLCDGFVSVDMGEPSFEPHVIGLNADTPCINQSISIEGTEIVLTAVSMPNPHAVIFVDEALPKDVFLATGPVVEHDPFFRKRTNVEFVTTRSRREIDVTVWERGAGATLACGTAACASVVAGVKTGRLDPKVTVHLPGGVLSVEWNLERNIVILEGPAEKVFEGEYNHAI